MHPNEHALFNGFRRGETNLVTSMVTETAALAHAVDDAGVTAVLVA